MENKQQRASTATIAVRAVIVAIALGFLAYELHSLFAHIGGNELAVERPSPDSASSIGSDYLLNLYHDNEFSADRTFNGKWLKVSGAINSLGRTITGSPYLTLAGKNDVTISLVLCSFSREQEGELSIVHPGEKITVHGKCNGMSLGNVLIDDCEFIH